MVMTPPAGVVFDLDGTLVLTESRNAVVWRRFFEANGIGSDDDLAHHVAGRRAQDSLVELTHLFPDQPMDELLSQVAALELTVPLSDVKPVAGAVHLVHGLADAGIPFAEHDLRDVQHAPASRPGRPDRERRWWW
jgi:beta-phosphoglucomutase-like phosphatase (HAD superfamily)